MIETFVRDAKRRYPLTKKPAMDRLEMCLHDLYYYFLAGDTDQNGKLNYDESVSQYLLSQTLGFRRELQLVCSINMT